MIINTDSIIAKDIGDGYVVGEVKGLVRGLSYLDSGAIVCLFDGLNVALEYVKEKMPKAQRGKSSNRTDREEYNTFATYKQALDTFLYEPQKVVKFDETQLTIKDVDESGNQVDFDVTGDFIDMGRYLEGVPESFGTMHNGNARNRRATVYINLNQWAGLNESTINHRAERVLRMVDAMEASGVRCEIIGLLSNECAHIEIVMKQHSETLVITDLAVLCHSEFLRRIYLRIAEHSKTWTYNYGSALAFEHAVTPRLIESENNNDIVVYVGSNMERDIDRLFDRAERLLVWEMSKATPEVSSININKSGVRYGSNGSRPQDDIVREAEAILNE